MRTWHIFCILVLLFLIFPGFSASCPAEGGARPSLVLEHDLKNDQEYENFRTCRDPFRNAPPPHPSRQGLDTLTMSGSSEFSMVGLRKIRGLLPSSCIVIVDLREECHGFINGRPVSWKNDHNDANRRKSLDEIVKMEKELLARARRDDPSIRSTSTEEELCHEQGLGYVRFAVTDHSRPTDAVVDHFMAFVRHLPSGAWLHFHCKAGMGRTTTFMAMYDMMRNAREVSFEDILARQYILGGMDLSGRDIRGSAWFDLLARERALFVRDFYGYCQKGERVEFKERGKPGER